MKVDYYYSLTPVQFFNTIKGDSEVENARIQASWEQARLVAMAIVQVNSKKTIKPTDIKEFPWDKEPESETIDINEARKRIKEKYYSTNQN